MPQDTLHLPEDQTQKPKSTSPSSAAPTPSTPTFHTNIPQKSFNKLIPVVIILTILTLTGLGTSIFFGIQNANHGTEIANLKEQINKGQNSTIIIDDEEVPETPSEPSDQPTTVTKADVLAEVPKNLGLTNAKCLNCKNELTYSVSAENAVFNAHISPNKDTATISFTWEDIARIYNISYEGKTGYNFIDNIKLSGPATDVFIATFGQSGIDETVLFLMEDGTVEYLPLYTAIKNNDFRSYGQIPELKNIIKFYTGGVNVVGAVIGAGNQTFAQRADGTFYELYSLLKSTGNYDDSRWQ